MKDTNLRGQERFEWLRGGALQESEWRDEIQHPSGVNSGIPFVMVCKNTGGVCAREGTGLLTTSMHVLCLTGEHEIPERGELVDDNDRHFETYRNFQNCTCWNGFANGIAASAVGSNCLNDVLATW